MTRWGMIIDLDRCIGCRSCMVACKMHNGIPPGTWWHRVETVGAKEHQITPGGNYPDVEDMYYLPMPCMHCENPPCVKVCPVGATWSREDGVVLIDFERCIGCRYCITACPYGVRQFNWQDPDENYKAIFKISTNGRADGFALEGYRHGYPFDHRTNGRLVYTPKRPIGVTEKCTFCVQYLDQGELPACVRGCPANTRVFGDLDDPNSEISQLLREQSTFRLLEDLGTKPKVFYIPPQKRRKRGEIYKVKG